MSNTKFSSAILNLPFCSQVHILNALQHVIKPQESSLKE